MAKTGPPVKTDGPVYFVTASYIPELLQYTTPTRGMIPLPGLFFGHENLVSWAIRGMRSCVIIHSVVLLSQQG